MKSGRNTQKGVIERCYEDLHVMLNWFFNTFIPSRQWLEIQRLRNKVKRKVETKASKGRKIR
jgi:hypothetical protein